MITEIYRIEPKDGSDIQQLAKDGDNLLLREKLGLAPLELKSEGASFFRFRKMTEEEAGVYGVLFPTKTEIGKYREFIPNEALEALAEFNETCPHRIIGAPVVWHAKEYNPDPVLVVDCRAEKDAYNWADSTFIVARWGEALAPFAELAKEAFEKWKAKRLTKLEGIKEQVDMDLRKTQRAACIGKIEEPTFYG